SGIIDGYISEKPEAISATTANAKFGMAEFAKGQGFKYTPDDVAIAVGLKKGNTELAEEINKILVGLSQEERVELMNQAILNQPVAK
ncbi:MAG: ABC transporter substrate-binding protein, partial [Syntrophomonadaceae bacterium]|nr:ABC transporter substrate-binding protein [Syntrophomonadaceae bacterium]